MTRIVDSVLVDDDCADQSTELDQCMPVATVAGEPRGLDREYGADRAGADSGQQPLEPGTDNATTRASEIIVDDLDRAPAELLGAIGEPVLPTAALVIVGELVCGRLPDVDEGATRQVLGRDLTHDRPPLPPCWRVPLRSRAAALPPQSRVPHCALASA